MLLDLARRSLAHGALEESPNMLPSFLQERAGKQVAAPTLQSEPRLPMKIGTSGVTPVVREDRGDHSDAKDESHRLPSGRIPS
jgi:hypothetical protein